VSSGFGVGTEDFQKLAVTPQLFYGLFNVGFGNMAQHIQEEIYSQALVFTGRDSILERLTPRRAKGSSIR